MYIIICPPSLPANRVVNRVCPASVLCLSCYCIFIHIRWFRWLTGSVDDELPSLDEASTSVDALVADDPVFPTLRHPPGVFEPSSRPITPGPPPGLGSIPHSHPSPAVPHSSLQTNRGRQTPPAVPLKPGTKVVTPSGAEAKRNVRALAIESGLSKEIASKSKSPKVLQDEDFPALDTPRAPARPSTPSASSKAGAKPAPAASKKIEKSGELVSEKLPAEPPAVLPQSRSQPRTAGKKPTPGALNIAAATNTSQKNAELSSADKSIDKDPSFPSLPTPSAVSSPVTRAAPKTLRVVPTPKTEAPPPLFGATGGYIPALPTRSVAAVAARPETPISEIISDSTSVASASVSQSRTSSPPPQKVGTAPVRATTKSQLRKQRKEAIKKDAAVIVAQPAKQAEQEVEIGPIVGRKKKQKKAKPTNQEVTPTTAQPESQPESRTETPIPPQPAAQPATKESRDTKEAKEMKEPKEPKEVKDETSTYRTIANESTSLMDDKFSRKKASETKGKRRPSLPPGD
ncbi:hypothetical protein GQ53DRAFT_287251 [Thozetella sp. PMI_491]|nr:hypothetical protein GQ53DRAFT_287251 [Thozetella sp. PMI_491]